MLVTSVRPSVCYNRRCRTSVQFIHLPFGANMNRNAFSLLIVIVIFAMLFNCASAEEPSSEHFSYLRMRGVPSEIGSDQVALASADRQGDDDIRCAIFKDYVGGLCRYWGLIIEPPPSYKFNYWFDEQIFSKGLTGTYKIEDGLAIFTGDLVTGPEAVVADQNQKSRPIRFGLNYAFIDDLVHFNLLVRDKDGSYRYHRKWYRSVDDRWEPLEEQRLVFTKSDQSETQVVFKVRGNRTRWNEDQQEKSEDVDLFATYLLRKSAPYFRIKEGLPGWLPILLYPNSQEESSSDRPDFYLLSGGGIGSVRGFVFNDPRN